MRAARHQPGEMGHVDDEIGPDLVADGAEAGEVPVARVGRAAGDDQFRLVLARQPGDALHVDALRLAVDAVGDRLEPAPRHVDRRAVGQMAAGGEVEPHERVARLHQRHEHALIGLAAGIGLDVGEAAGKQLAGALDRQILGDVDELAAAVIAPAGIPFGVFVGHHRALRLEHRLGDDVLRGDQLDLVALAAELQLDRAGDLGIGIRRAPAEKNELERIGWATASGMGGPATKGGISRRGLARSGGGGKGGRDAWALDDGGARVAASASPHVAPLPFSDPAGVDPEESIGRSGAGGRRRTRPTAPISASENRTPPRPSA